MAALHLARRRTEGGEAIAVLRLDRPPAHAISRGFLVEIRGALDGIDRDPPRALLLAAAGERFFSAGLDLLDLFDLDRPAIEAFSRDLIDFYLRLFRLPFPVVAAVNGHAIAGGIILALTADRRILARGDHLLGLNEAQVGLALPGPLFEVVRSVLGGAAASEALLEGNNYGAADAVRVGFVHEVVEKSELETHALQAAERMARVPPRAFARMKFLLHAEAEERIHRIAHDADPFVDLWFDPATREAMGKAREKLTARKSGKGGA